MKPSENQQYVDEEVPYINRGSRSFTNEQIRDIQHLIEDEVATRFKNAEQFSKEEVDNESNTGQNQIENSSGLHLNAVITECTPDSTTTWRFVMALCSIFLVIMQLLVIIWLNLDASNPTCSLHTDCNMGENCAPFKAGPRCSDCPTVSYEQYEYCQQYLDFEENTLIWTSKGYEYHPTLNGTEIECMRRLHCVRSSIIGLDSNDKLFDGNGAFLPEDKSLFEELRFTGCDHLKMTLTKLSYTHVLVFMFVSLIYAVHLFEDIDESMNEEAILNYGLSQRIFRRPDSSRIPLSAGVIRLSLRIRKFVLPWFAAAGGGLITVRETMSSRNLLLNVLAIGFITEADNRIGKMFLNKRQTRYIDNYISKLNVLDRDSFVSNFTLFRSRFLGFWSRFLACLPIFVMIIVVINNRRLMEFMAPRYFKMSPCGNISWIISYFFFFYCPIVVVFLESIIQACQSNRRIRPWFVPVMLNMAENFNAIFLGMFVWYLAETFVYFVRQYYILIAFYGVVLLVNIGYTYYMHRLNECIIDRINLRQEATPKIFPMVLSILYICSIFGLITFEILAQRDRRLQDLLEGDQLWYSHEYYNYYYQ